MIGIIVQARMSSSRLPGKVAKPILGKPMLQWQLDRISAIPQVTKVIVATSNNSEDDEIAQLCNLSQTLCFRGDLDDVLDRFYQCAQHHALSTIIRITGDCPVIDDEIITQLIEKHLAEHNDYTNNFESCTLPDGLDCEIFSFAVLQRAWQEAKKPSEREHVTPYIRNLPDIKKGELTFAADISHLRWTVDNPEDFELISIFYQKLHKNGQHFRTHDILALLEREPELKTMNIHIKRNEGMDKSLLQDKKSGF